jgi:hypothetical protein
MEARSIDDITDLVRKNKKWSKYVEEIWLEQYRKAADLPFAETVPDSDSDWQVMSADRMISHLVTSSNDRFGRIPTCTCFDFTSTLIPCAGICAVFSRIDASLFCVENLHRRWRIDGHPLFRKVLQRLKLASPDVTEGAHQETIIPGTSQSHIDMTAYQSVVYPSKSDVRYTKINNLWKTVEPHAINNEHTYRLLTVNLVAFRNSLNGEGRSAFLQPDCLPLAAFCSADVPASSTLAHVPVLPPPKRQRGSDDINR